MKTLAAFLVVAAISVATPSMSSCATTSATLERVDKATDVGVLVVDAIDGFEKSYFAQHPDAQKQAAVELQIARVRALAAAVKDAVAGADSLQDARVSDAFHAFENAYAALVELGSSFGVRAAPAGTSPGKMNAAPGTVIVPAPVDLLRCMTPPGKASAASSARPAAARWAGICVGCMVHTT